MMRDNSKKKLTLLFLISIIFIACFDIWVGASTSKAPVSHTPTTHSNSFLDAPYLGLVALTNQSLLIVLLDRSSSLVEGSPRTDPTVITVPGQGVYTGDTVYLECYKRGGTVSPYYNNPLWYWARVITGQGEGWVKATTIDSMTVAVSALIDNLGNNALLCSGLTKQINDLAWSPNGQYIASASTDGPVQIWDTFDRSHLFASLHHSWIVNSIAWSYDTHTQISLDNENRGIRIWNASRRRLYQLRVASFIDHPGNITAAYASIEKALHFRQVEILVAFVDRYNESLANEFSQRFLANAHRGRVWVHKELNDEQLKQLSALSDGTQEGFK